MKKDNNFTIIFLVLLLLSVSLLINGNSSSVVLTNDSGLSLNDWFKTDVSLIELNATTTLNGTEYFQTLVFNSTRYNASDNYKPFNYQRSYWLLDKQTGFRVAEKSVTMIDGSWLLKLRSMPSMITNSTFNITERFITSNEGILTDETKNVRLFMNSTVPSRYIYNGTTTYTINGTNEYVLSFVYQSLSTLRTGYMKAIDYDDNITTVWTFTPHNDTKVTRTFSNGSSIVWYLKPHDENITLEYYSPSYYSFVYMHDMTYVGSPLLFDLSVARQQRLKMEQLQSYNFVVRQAYVKNYQHWNPNAPVNLGDYTITPTQTNQDRPSDEMLILIGALTSLTLASVGIMVIVLYLRKLSG